MITLNQLRIFWAVAHGNSLTRAAKQLGVTQPALSQQLAKLETALGGQLFDRVNNQLILTDAGRFLLRKAETVLAEMDEAEAGLADFRLGRRRRIAVGALASLARTIVPEAFRLALELVPDLELDLHELAPAEALEQLYGRNLQLALLSSVSLAANRVSFTRIDIARDPYVLAAPRGLDLGCIHMPETELSPEHQRILTGRSSSTSAICTTSGSTSGTAGSSPGIRSPPAAGLTNRRWPWSRRAWAWRWSRSSAPSSADRRPMMSTFMRCRSWSGRSWR